MVGGLTSGARVAALLGGSTEKATNRFVLVIALISA